MKHFINEILSFRAITRNLFFIVPFVSVFSQVTSKVDTTLIRIGEEIKYTIQVEADSTDLVLFPEGQSFSPLEMIESYKVDTSFADAKFRLIKRYGLTQFDSGSYTIPVQRVMINDRKFDTDSVRVEVRDVSVDTTKQKMFDIKPAIDVNTSDFDWLKLLYWLLPFLFIAGLIYYFFRRKKLKEEREKQLPPYEEAMVALQKLDATEYLKENKGKAYYSSLTEIVKRYIDREVDDKALESTSDELIERLLLHKDSGHFDFDQEMIRKLDAILKRADLVKFAKFQQELSQATSDRKTIEEIINETHEAIPEPTEEEMAENEAYLELLAKRKKRKQWVYGISFVISAIVAGLVAYGSITGFDNLKDKIFGNELREMAEARWYRSEYGNPAVIIETPEVLKRISDSVAPQLQQVVKQMSVFSAGDLREAFFMTVSTMQLNPTNEEIDLNAALDGTLMELDNRGAKNMIMKREDFETEKGIKGLKAHGDFNVQVSESRMLKEKSSYELLIFAQQGGIQTVLLVYQDDGTYAEQIKNRIIDSVELEITNEGEKQEK
ncbi:DUF4381 domain-containing protein [Aureisphaera sp. CAU 1614]|uniref:DUF4381 domain-containing protein n=1 Tax=Halomarinibacterium sedimenti TaxID=2857106 RepID=A0A9X1FNB6_9FLAO|nr:DUF4381 domain-containing protein [Halomarinibacterium sedimenti]MBW2937373.1 DUF4381 domain-containing protein [Halomarinibacterium sedimenti]